MIIIICASSKQQHIHIHIHKQNEKKPVLQNWLLGYFSRFQIQR